MKIIDTDEKVLQQCTNFQIEDQGIIAQNENGEQIGFFPFRSFHRIISNQAPHGQKTRQSQAPDQTPSQPQTQSQGQGQSQTQPQAQNRTAAPSQAQTQSQPQNQDQNQNSNQK